MDRPLEQSGALQRTTMAEPTEGEGIQKVMQVAIQKPSRFLRN